MAEWTDFQWYGKSHIRFDPIFFIGSTVIFFLHIYRNTKLLIFIFYNIWRDLTNSLELPNLINKNTWCAVKLECQINNKYFLRSHTWLHRNDEHTHEAELCRNKTYTRILSKDQCSKSQWWSFIYSKTYLFQMSTSLP